MKKFVAVLAAVLMSASFAQGQSLTGSYPAEGGPITVTSSGGVVAAAGLDFVSSNAGLVPTGGVPAPFAFLLSDTASQVTYGNLGSTVNIDGDLTLSVGATAGAEIAASWGMGATPVAFPVDPIGGEEPLVSADLSGLAAIFAPDNAIWGGQVIMGSIPF